MKFFTQMFDAVPSALIVINDKGIIVQANRTVSEIFGYTSSELIGSEIELLLPVSMHKAHKQHVKNYFAAPADKKMGAGRVFLGRRNDGASIHVRVGLNFFEENDETFAIANVIDVSESHRLQNLMDRVQEIANIGGWQVDLINNTVTWSSMTYKIHELDESTKVVLEDGINFYAPEYRPVISNCVQECINNRTSWDEELKIITTTGKEKWVRAIGGAVVIDGQVVGLEGTFQDIDGQKRAQEKMRSLTNRLTLALEASKFGVWEWVIPNDELIWDTQMYALYGIKESDFDGAYHAWLNGLHPDDVEPSQRLITHVLAGEAKFDSEFRVVWPDGTVRYIRALATVENDKDNKPYKMIGVNWDITNIKQYERDLLDTNISLERANDELMQFAYRSSHDIKAPLIGIRGLSDIILADLSSGNHKEVEQNIKFIKDQALTLETLVNDLLNLSKVDMSVDATEEIHFDNIIDEVIGLNLTMSQVNQVQVRQSVEVSSTWYFPTVRILQIINNLVSNSIKYCDLKKASRFVSIKIQERKDTLDIIVQDNGTGIDYTNKQEVFKMFVRFHSNKIAGSGLGMYVLQKHVHALNGEVDFNSSSEGTTFTVSIPRLG